ncbi:unnamed protein product [Anisakis simplex]|uniref:AAA domain-containing protein n=1 Tax=Anisakis simplex TaxID=6269 RepID=A0A0M3K733_ANISI|nr:unnamed protein product [Anisakis simplex]
MSGAVSIYSNWVLRGTIEGTNDHSAQKQLACNNYMHMLNGNISPAHFSLHLRGDAGQDLGVKVILMPEKVALSDAVVSAMQNPCGLGDNQIVEQRSRIVTAIPERQLLQTLKRFACGKEDIHVVDQYSAYKLWLSTMPNPAALIPPPTDESRPVTGNMTVRRLNAAEGSLKSCLVWQREYEDYTWILPDFKIQTTANLQIVEVVKKSLMQSEVLDLFRVRSFLLADSNGWMFQPILDFFGLLETQGVLSFDGTMVGTAAIEDKRLRMIAAADGLHWLYAARELGLMQVVDLPRACDDVFPHPDATAIEVGNIQEETNRRIGVYVRALTTGRLTFGTKEKMNVESHVTSGSEMLRKYADVFAELGRCKKDGEVVVHFVETSDECALDDYDRMKLVNKDCHPIAGLGKGKNQEARRLDCCEWSALDYVVIKEGRVAAFQIEYNTLAYERFSIGVCWKAITSERYFCDYCPSVPGTAIPIISQTSVIPPTSLVSEVALTAKGSEHISEQLGPSGTGCQTPSATQKHRDYSSIHSKSASSRTTDVGVSSTAKMDDISTPRETAIAKSVAGHIAEAILYIIYATYIQSTQKID